MHTLSTEEYIPKDRNYKKVGGFYKIDLIGNRIAFIPKTIKFDKDLSWLIGFWVGDNFSSREGTVVRNGIKTSARFGITSNDVDIVKYAVKLFKTKFNLCKTKADIQLPKNYKKEVPKWKKWCKDNLNLTEEDILVYYGSDWRKHMGVAVYVNNTYLARIFLNIYNNLEKYIKENIIDSKMFLSGLADSEGHVHKISRHVDLTTKDKYVLKLIKICAKNSNLKFKIDLDKRQRYRIKFRNLHLFESDIGFRCERKSKALKETLKGNLSRERDLVYLKMFRSELKKGISSTKLSKIFNIPEVTVRIVLRNLYTGGHIKREKVGLSPKGYAYIYTLSPA